MLERILIVGYGSIGKRHAKIAKELLPNTKIMVFRHKSCDGMLTKDIDFCVTNLDDALKFKPQLAIIANPATHHLNVALPLAKSKVHLLIEKPISNTTQGITEIIDICKLNKTILMTGYNLRYLKSLQKFRELIYSKRVGKVLSVRAEIGQYLPSWRPNSNYRGNVSARSELGGGVLLELSHDIDYLCWLFGEVSWVSSVQSKQSDLDVDVEDTAHLTIGFSKNDNVKPLIATLNMDFIRHDTTRNCTVIGEDGTLKWNALTGVVKVILKGESEWTIIYDRKNNRDDSYLAEWEHLLDCINGDKNPLVTGQDGVSVLKVIEAARKSSDTKSIVSIN